ncbi:DUF2196 domain-containing protein [Halorientalis brevis]|uniref:DUF2196 domain-containing protein n=1 Tax=Halorientalis brevis TaxID=1126241 RepID=A0ABD6CCP8_9EURY|nr:DUF2196 domain-containing protein [Halorientalis brevis]
MAEDLPTRDEIDRGMTVEVVQEQDNNPGEPLIGDVRVILTDEHSHPQGIKVELDDDVTGGVKEIHPDEDDRDLPQGGG